VKREPTNSHTFGDMSEGSGTEVFDDLGSATMLREACRSMSLLFEPEIGSAGHLWITEGDFAHGRHGNRLTDSFDLEAVVSELSDAERARMAMCLAPFCGSDFARIRLWASLLAPPCEFTRSVSAATPITTTGRRSPEKL
jgi:hypothetical protein